MSGWVADMVVTLSFLKQGQQAPVLGKECRVFSSSREALMEQFRGQALGMRCVIRGLQTNGNSVFQSFYSLL